MMVNLTNAATNQDVVIKEDEDSKVHPTNNPMTNPSSKATVLNLKAMCLTAETTNKLISTSQQ